VGFEERRVFEETLPKKVSNATKTGDGKWKSKDWTLSWNKFQQVCQKSRVGADVQYYVKRQWARGLKEFPGSLNELKIGTEGTGCKQIQVGQEIRGRGREKEPVPEKGEMRSAENIQVNDRTNGPRLKGIRNLNSLETES